MDKHDLQPDIYGYFHPTNIEEFLWAITSVGVPPRSIVAEESFIHDLARRVLALEERA